MATRFFLECRFHHNVAIVGESSGQFENDLGKMGRTRLLRSDLHLIEIGFVRYGIEHYCRPAGDNLAIFFINPSEPGMT